MAGPYPQYPDPQLSQPPIAAASVYPGMLPPPVPYPSGRRWRLLAVILLVLAIVGGATAAVVYALTADSHAQGGQLTEAAAKAAIQDYLDAMEQGDTEAVARNTQCGYYDEIKDKRSHQALARLTSETFRKQFSRAEVTSIDKMVFLSDNQAQVLFSMQVAPLARGSKEHEEQAIAQVLSTDDGLLVCQYLLLSAGQY